MDFTSISKNRLSMTEKRIALFSLLVAFVALIFSIRTYNMQKSQYDYDYQEELLFESKDWPLKRISSNSGKSLTFSLKNTSKKNVDYFIRLYGEGVCIQKTEKLDLFDSCDLESKIHTLSKPEAGAHSKKHSVYLSAIVDERVIAPLNFGSDNEIDSGIDISPRFSVKVEIVSANSGKTLYQSKCSYSYDFESKSLNFYKPIIDTSGLDKVLHSECFRVASNEQ